MGDVKEGKAVKQVGPARTCRASSRPSIVEVASYSGYRGEETPRAVTVEGARFEVSAVLSRERIMDGVSREIRERWRCRLEDGRVAVLERLSDGTWRANLPS